MKEGKIQGMDFGINNKHKPDMHWALSVLSTLKHDHRFFDVNYQASGEERKSKPNAPFLFDNADGLLDDLHLHPSSSKDKKAKCSIGSKMNPIKQGKKAYTSFDMRYRNMDKSL